MRVLTRILVAAMVAVGVLAPALTRPAAADPGTSTFVAMTGEPSDWVAGGGSYLWRPGSGSVDVSKQIDGETEVDVSGGTSHQDYELSFTAPEGEALAPGTYDDAVDAAFPTGDKPGIDIEGEGRACTPTGRFIVYDAPSDLSRLWLVFEQHCDGNEDALFGEVKYNEPDDGSGLMVAPDHIRWPDTYPDVWRQAVPVTLVNTGVIPITVDSATITEDAADFAVQDNNCTILAPGDSCAVVANFRPTSPGPRSGTLTISDSTPVGSHTVELAGTGQSGYTSLDAHSQQGDVVGLGQDYSHWPGDSATYVNGDDSQVHLDLATHDNNDANTWSMDFVASAGHPMVSGETYQVEQRMPDNWDAAGMGTTVGPRGCTIVSGWFTVDQVEYHSDGRVTAFAARFEQHCAGIKPGLVGSVAWRAPEPAKPVPLDTTPPGPARALTATPGAGTARLAWRDPTDKDFSHTVVRRARGTTAPASPTSGVAVYSGTAGHVLAHVPTAATYTFAAFPLDTEGNVGRKATVTVLGTRLTFARSRASLVYGDTSVLSGRVLTPAGSTGIRDTRVRVQYRLMGSARWHPLSSVTTNSRGVYRSAVRPGRRTDYRVLYSGSRRRVGAVSTVRLINAAPRITVSSRRAAGTGSGAELVTAHVGPRLFGVEAWLQQRSGSSWVLIAKHTLNRASATSFRVPLSMPSAVYRVTTPATFDNTVGHSPQIRIG